jgi:hypothetical protein
MPKDRRFNKLPNGENHIRRVDLDASLFHVPDPAP